MGGNCVCNGDNNACNTGGLSNNFFCHTVTNVGKCQCGGSTCNFGQTCDSNDNCSP